MIRRGTADAGAGMAHAATRSSTPKKPPCLRATEPSRRYQCRVRVRPPVAVELPDVAHFADLVEVEFGGDQFAAVARSGRDKAAARVVKVTLPVEFPDVPRRF